MGVGFSAESTEVLSWCIRISICARSTDFFHHISIHTHAHTRGKSETKFQNDFKHLSHCLLLSPLWLCCKITVGHFRLFFCALAFYYLSASPPTPGNRLFNSLLFSIISHQYLLYVFFFFRMHTYYIIDQKSLSKFILCAYMYGEDSSLRRRGRAHWNNEKP